MSPRDVRPEVVLTSPDVSMSPSVRPDERSSKALWENCSDTGRTAHFRAVGAQRGAPTPDVRPVSGADINRMANLACPRPRPTVCECRATIAHVTAAAVDVWLVAPSTDRTPPAGTLPLSPVVSNVRFANSLLGFMIESARVSPRSRRGMLSTIIEPLKIDPVPLGASQIPTHKPATTPPRCCVASA